MCYVTLVYNNVRAEQRAEEKEKERKRKLEGKIIYITLQYFMWETAVGQTPAITKRPRRMSDEGASSVRVAIDLSCDELMTEKVSTHLWLYS